MKNKTNRILYFLLFPALVLYVVFWVLPVIMSFFYGDYHFVGLQNFQYLLGDGTLVNALKNTGVYTLFTVVFGNILALTIAFILNMKLRLKGAFRTVFYIPVQWLWHLSGVMFMRRIMG